MLFVTRFHQFTNSIYFSLWSVRNKKIKYHDYTFHSVEFDFHSPNENDILMIRNYYILHIGCFWTLNDNTFSSIEMIIIDNNLCSLFYHSWKLLKFLCDIHCWFVIQTIAIFHIRKHNICWKWCRKYFLGSSNTANKAFSLHLLKYEISSRKQIETTYNMLFYSLCASLGFKMLACFIKKKNEKKVEFCWNTENKK